MVTFVCQSPLCFEVSKWNKVGAKGRPPKVHPKGILLILNGRYLEISLGDDTRGPSVLLKAGNKSPLRKGPSL